MLYEFLETNSTELVERCRDKVTQRSPGAEQRELRYGIAPFLDQLIQTLRVEQSSDDAQAVRISGPPGGEPVQ